MITKDESIVAQVAAKIAADLIPHTGDIGERLSDWATAYQFVKQELFDTHGFGTQPSAAPTAYTVDQATAILEQQFGATTAATPTFNVRVKGDQHGPLPDWLAVECQRANVYEVYDNRNSLAENPKRPWFRGTSGKDAPAFWPPKGR